MASDASSQITLQVMAFMPTGESEKGLGTNHWSIDPSILYSTDLGDHATIEAEFGSVLPTDGSAGVPTSSPDKFAGKVIHYGVGPSFDVYSNDHARVAAVVELVGWHIVDGFSTFERRTGQRHEHREPEDWRPSGVRSRTRSMSDGGRR